tara:strand:- start:3628 stop:3798 length:171 start_codon:yes stop_codon:yes gene_type:complete
MVQQKKLDNEGFNYNYLDERTLDAIKSLQKTADWLATLSKEEVKQWLIDNKLINHA